MSEFQSKLQIELNDPSAEDHTGTWNLLSVLRYQSDLLGEVVVPVGFFTDLASVPRDSIIAWGLFGGRGMRAAVVHDFLCRMHWYRRELVDQVFLEALLVDGMSLIRAMPMYLAVAAYTATGTWKTDVDQDGFEPLG